MDLTEQEQQLIEIIREQQGNDDLLRLSLSFLGGLWHIKMSANNDKPTAEGTGRTFDEAFEELAPEWARRPRLSVVPKDE